MDPLADTLDIGPSRHEADSFHSHDSTSIRSLPLFEGANHTNIEFAERFREILFKKYVIGQSEKRYQIIHTVIPSAA